MRIRLFGSEVIMNHAEKIAKLVEKFGESVGIKRKRKTPKDESCLPIVGQLDIVSVGDCWKVTFICHGATSFFCDGIARCALFRKDTGECGDIHSASVLKYTHSKKKRRLCNDEKEVLDIFNKIAVIVDLVYYDYFSE